MNSRLKWQLAFAFLLVFIAGATSGGLFSSMHMQRHFFGPPHSGDMGERFREHLKEALDLGVTFFAGEAEGRMAGLLRDIDAGTLKPIYNYLADMPEMIVEIVDRREIPAVGAGESPITLPAPAIANALFAATGDRRRSLPLVA